MDIYLRKKTTFDKILKLFFFLIKAIEVSSQDVSIPKINIIYFLFDK